MKPPKRTSLSWTELSDSWSIAPVRSSWWVARHKKKKGRKTEYSYGAFRFNERNANVYCDAPPQVGGQYYATGLSPAAISYCVWLWRSSAKKAIEDMGPDYD